MTQEEKVLDYMDRFGSITALEAMADLGIMRLAARISDLENKRNVRIHRVTESGKNRFGERTTYTRYSLEMKHGA